MQNILILTYPPLGDESQPGVYEGKFLQLTWRGQGYLIFASRQLHHYHNQILGNFLADNRIAHRWVTEARLEVNDPDLVVIGGGRFRLNLGDMHLELWDNSQLYGRFDEQGLFEKIAAAHRPWSSVKVSIA